MTSIIKAIIVFVIGLVLLPVFQTIITSIDEDIVQDLPGLSAIESAWPTMLIVALFVLIVVTAFKVIKRGSKRKDDDDFSKF